MSRRMDAHDLLTSQGWRGKGHSLHASSDAIGLSKPLPLSRKDDTKGLGATKHFTSDQWWMSAFDEQLKGLDTSQDGKVLQTATVGQLGSIAKASRGRCHLYASFVRGGLLRGTMPDDKVDVSSSTHDAHDARAANAPPSPPSESKQERRATRAEKRRRKEERARRRILRRERKQKASESGAGNEDADAERRRRRAEKKQRRCDKEAARAKKRQARRA